MYENETFDLIMQRMLSNISDDIDKREGSIAYDMLAPKASELAIAYTQLDGVLDFGFAETTYGEYLDRKVNEHGVTREVAVKAKSTVVFDSDVVTLVPQNTVVFTDDGIRFLTDTDVTLVNGAGTVTVTAEEGGNIGNVPANSIINTEIPELFCNNANPSTGGFDVESDEALLTRFLNTVRSPATSGNVHHYKQWALEVAGIGDAKVIPIWNGPNTVKVVVIGADRKPVTTGKATEVKTHIEDVRPIGANVTVESAASLTVTVSATLTLENGYTTGLVLPVVEEKLTQLLKEISFVDTSVKISKVGMVLLDTPGILDYTDLKLNNGTANLTLAANTVPVLGTVTLT